MKTAIAILLFTGWCFAKDHPKPVYDQTGVFHMAHDKYDVIYNYTPDNGIPQSVGCSADHNSVTNQDTVDCVDNPGYPEITEKDGTDIQIFVQPLDDKQSRHDFLKQDANHLMDPLIGSALGTEVHFRVLSDEETHHRFGQGLIASNALCIPWNIYKKGKVVKQSEKCYQVAIFKPKHKIEKGQQSPPLPAPQPKTSLPSTAKPRLTTV